MRKFQVAEDLHAVLISAAEQHALDTSEPDMQVGDLEIALHACLQRLTPQQREEVYHELYDELCLAVYLEEQEEDEA
jgi:DNA-directed RNA polymerase specialized sigma24 family protein